jgi:hypothetical protein
MFQSTFLLLKAKFGLSPATYGMSLFSKFSLFNTVDPDDIPERVVLYFPDACPLTMSYDD